VYKESEIENKPQFKWKKQMKNTQFHNERKVNYKPMPNEMIFNEN